MKRTFLGVVRYTRTKQGSGIDLSRPFSKVCPARTDYRSFQRLFGVSCRKGRSGEMTLNLRLIRAPLPWHKWVWPAESQYPANRLVVQYAQEGFWFDCVIPDGHPWLIQCCAVEMGKIFPGWTKAFRKDYVCEAEITVENHRTQTRGKKHAPN